MSEVIVIPAIMPTINWTEISIHFRHHTNLIDPIKNLDSAIIKRNDPASIIVGLNAIDHCYLGFIVTCPQQHTPLIHLATKYNLDIKFFEDQETVTFLISGFFSDWLEAIPKGCTEEKTRLERLIFIRILELMETTKLKKYFQQYTKKELKDGSFILCRS